LKEPAPGGEPRRAPNQDKEVMRGVLEAFHRIADTDAERKQYQEEFTAFHMKKGMFSFQSVQNDATTMTAIDWWSN
jgi:aspartate/tyrosine/aromatic aminotransferase